MEKLFNEQRILLEDTDLKFERYLMDELPWKERLLGIQGFRGVGKTTLLLQYIKKNYSGSEKALYVSLDNFYFADNSLVDFAGSFVAKGGEHLFLDEVHKYKNWAVELKNIYDLYKNLKVTFTASSLLEILNSKADLSRRAVVFFMHGLSFREYLNFVLGTDFKPYGLNDILANHQQIAAGILQGTKPLQYFNKYISKGYYPFFMQGEKLYYHRLQSIVNMVIEIELPLLKGVDPGKIVKLKQLLYVIAQSAPFKPNISKLAGRIGVTRNTLVEYINHLADSKLLNKLFAGSAGISLLQKPDKLYLENTNLSFAISGDNSNTGNVRETFFFNQIIQRHAISYPKKGDFFVDNKYIFEIGGKNKSFKQIAGLENAYIAADDIEYGYGNKIPLWLFGFLY
jgi:predicted AAA+ superfamily ATPase